MRKKTRGIRIGSVKVGNGAPVAVQSMARSSWEDVEGNLREIRVAAGLGCEVMRLAVPSVKAAEYFGRVAARSALPLVADTHFDWRVTLAAIGEGAAKVRINPGNMDAEGLARVVDAAGERGIPIRVGGNSGSILHRRGGGGGEVDMAETMVGEALEWAGKMEDMGFTDTVLSFKSSDARETVRANRLASERSEYPLHLGVTSAGWGEEALMKSASAMGGLLLDGIGDTVRFSFTGDMEGEVRAGVSLVRGLGVGGGGGVRIVSCPGCGRCRVNLGELAQRVRERLAGVEEEVTVAVMGCEVNGPGEASMADVGVASAGGVLHVFVEGRVVAKVAADEAVEYLADEVERIAAGMRPDRLLEHNSK